MKQDARTLLNYLRGRGFLHRRQIPADLFGGNDRERRRVRAVCQAFPEHFVSTQAGYCVAAEAPTDTLRESVATLRSQARRMDERADSLQRVLDGRVNGQKRLAI